MNENRSVWALNGLTGGLIATGLLLAILAFLSVNAMSVQHANATNYYKIKDEKSIKRISTDNYKHIVDVK
jgi:YbbR domain-containing protein